MVHHHQLCLIFRDGMFEIKASSDDTLGKNYGVEIKESKAGFEDKELSLNILEYFFDLKYLIEKKGELYRIIRY